MRTNAQCRSVDREIRPAGNQETVTLGSSRASALVVSPSRALAGAAEGKHASAAAHGGGTFSDVASSRHACTSPGTGCICASVTGKRQLSFRALVTLRIPERASAIAFGSGGPGSGLRLAAHGTTGGGAERFTFARHDACAGRSAGWIVSGFESRGARLFFWIAARHPALNKPGVGRDGNNTAAHAGARPGSTEPVEQACARRSSSTFARRVAGQPAPQSESLWQGAEGVSGLVLAPRCGAGCYTRASRAKTEKVADRNERGECLTRAHSHTGVPRSVPPTLLPSLAACAFAANGAGRAFFFAVGALVA
jgi:hypothetical protein